MSVYRQQPAPIPTPTPISKDFWEATTQHRLLLQRCARGHVFYYARTHCPECLSRELEWFEASGRGTLYSFTVIERAQSPDFEADVPYTVAAIALDHYGWLGFPVRPLDAWRAAGALLVIVGMFLLARG